MALAVLLTTNKVVNVKDAITSAQLIAKLNTEREIVVTTDAVAGFTKATIVSDAVVAVFE